MIKIESVPKRLYKYRAFDAKTVDLLVADQVYYADPSTFNDPFDTRPSLHADILLEQLEQTRTRLVEERVAAEMRAAADTLRYRGPKTMDHIFKQARREAAQGRTEIAYAATNPDCDEGAQAWLLGHQIEMELLRRVEKGVLSLAKRCSCPLMWSHYGDQHRGLCIGYSIPEEAKPKLKKVSYGGNRMVEASKVAAMLDGDAIASAEVDEAVFLRKASDWRYEKEWRHFGKRGIADSPLDLEEIVFGARCLPTVKHTVLKALAGRAQKIDLYEIRETPGSFKLNRYKLDEAELATSYPRRSRSVIEDFDFVEK